jgi:citrate synthase
MVATLARVPNIVNIDQYNQCIAEGTAYMTAEDAAAYLGVSRATLYAYVSRGLVVSEPAGDSSRRLHRYPRAAVERLKVRRELRRDPAHGALRGGAPVLESSLTLIDKGHLWYRGRDACQLSRTSTLEQVAALLWTGTTEGADMLFPRSTRQRVSGRRAVFADRLIACLVEQRVAHPLSLNPAGPTRLRSAGQMISTLFAAVGAIGRGSLAERLARGWRTPHADDLQAALILCADHGLSASAFTARCVASADAPIPNALLAAFCALEGRRHGGVCKEIDALLDDVERLGVKEVCERALARDGRIPGLGDPHPLYPEGDPRAIALLERIKLPPGDPAAQLIAFAKRYGGSPSIELALAAFSRRRSLPSEAAFTLFALGRSVGWVAHAFEAAELGTLIRPNARYIGPIPPD